ncbi:30665_t:CDS:2, partial [Gigaspora margarita]
MSYTGNVPPVNNDPDNTYDCLDSDFSLATDSVSETSSVLNDNNSHKFFFNYEALQKTRESIYNIDDNVTMNDIKDNSSFISSERNSTDFNALEEDYKIDDIPCENLIPCIVLDIYDGEIRRCPNYEKPRYQLRSLRQLIGTWKIDESVVDKNNPKEHCVNINNHSIQFPCIGCKVCSVFVNNDQLIEQSTTKKSITKTLVRFICSKCFQSEGGHLFERKGTGVKSYTCHDQHVDDKSNDEKLKQDTLNKMTIVLNKTYHPKAKNDKQNTTNQLTLMPSLLVIKTIIRLGKIKVNKLKNNHQLEKLLMSEDQSNNLEIFAKAKASLKDHLFEIGPSTFTNQMFLKFENIFHNLSACNEKEVDVDKVYKELVKHIEPGSEDELKLQISSVQTERECLDLLL